MLLLDDEEEGEAIPVAPLTTDPRNRPKPTGSGWRRLFLVVLVLVLGGGLGGLAYIGSTTDLRDLIGLMDVADTRPHLTFQMPGRPAPSAPAATNAKGDGLLLPPTSAPAAGQQAPSRDTANSGTGPVINPPVIEPPTPAKSKAADVAIPQAPTPRNPDHPPTFAALPSAAHPDTKPLGPVPVDALIRKGLPVAATDGRTSWKTYARPHAPAVGEQSRVAVVITGLGLNKDATDTAITKLPADVSLAFSPYAGGLDVWIKKARTAGHEVLLMLPTEGSSYPARDPGPLALLSSNTAEENLARLEKTLARAQGYVGVVVESGPFTRSSQFPALLSALKQRGVAYLGDSTPAMDAPPFAVGSTIDRDLFHDAIEASLYRVASMAHEDGQAVAVAHPLPVTLAALQPWLNGLSHQKLSLAPLSAVLTVNGKS